MSGVYIHGIHAVSRRLQGAPDRCLELICVEQGNPRIQQLIALARAAGVRVRLDKREQLTALALTDKHQGCLLLSEESAPQKNLVQCLHEIGPDTLLLVLDGVQDPHNLGACLRTADACGVDAVIVPKDRAVGLNATVRKVAAGGAESVPLVEVTNIVRALKDLKQAGVWIYGTGDAADSSLYTQDFGGPVALVMGAEGSGLRRLTREACDHLVRVPMLGQVESLNVSVATGVCLYEILRSRNSKN